MLLLFFTFPVAFCYSLSDNTLIGKQTGAIAMLTILGKISLIDKLIIPYTREDLSSFKKYIDNPVCDVCHRNHHRVELYIVDQDGNRYVAGKGCLDNKLGRSAVRTAITEAKETEKYIKSNCFEVREMIIGAIHLLEQSPFVASREGNSSAMTFKMTYIEHCYIGRSDRAIYDKANDIIEYYKNVDNTSTFIDSIKTLVSNEYCSEKVLGLFPALVHSYDVAIAKQRAYNLAKQHNLENSEYFGNPGDKITTDIDCTLIEVRQLDRPSYSYYDDSVSNQYFLKDENGHVFCWTTTNRIHVMVPGVKGTMYPKYFGADDIGTKLRLNRFTIKNHFESKLGKITAIIRPKYQVLSTVQDCVSKEE